MDAPKAIIGILTYESRALLMGLLDSILEREWRYAYEILVVDNNSTDGAAEMVEEDYPSVRLIRNEKNVGVAPARNQIFRASAVPYSIILDVDTEVHPGSLDRLVDTMEAHPEAGVAGPKLVYEDGSLQLSCRPFPKPLNVLLEGTFLRDWLPRTRFVTDYTMEEWDHAEMRDVDWMYGAALIFRNSVLDEVGHFDEGFFYLYEDIDLCFRIKKAGYPVLYDPEAVVTHFLRRERKGLFHNRIGVHAKSICRYLLKDHYGFAIRTQGVQPGPSGESLR